MKSNLYKIAKALVCMLYVGITYIGGMSLVFLSLLLYHNKNMQGTDFEFNLIIIGGALIGIVTDYLANKFKINGSESDERS